jgi:2-polyprenyl-3-methyl-5-hydroxy-6-metoxy-1,4-benzoquinol methylase
MLSFIDDNDQKILDYGCGSGHFTNRIKNSKPSCTVIGADINAYAINYARQRYNNIIFLNPDDHLFEQEDFDIIIVSHLLEHIHDREEFLQKVLCLLKKGGKIIISVPQERIRGDGTLFTIFINALRGIFINPHVVKLVYEDLSTLMAKVNVKTQSKIYTNYLYPFISDTRKWHSFSLVIIGEKRL